MKRLVCLLLGHDWPDAWGDNGCYRIHNVNDTPAERIHEHLLTRFCRRCDRMASRFEVRS